MNKKKNQMYNKEDTIDIIELLSVLWKKKLFIFKVTFLFGFIGVLYSINLDNTYKASSVFYPHIEKNNSPQGLKNLAGLAGINIGDNTSENIPTSLYPNLINSPQFKIEILNQYINFNGNKLTYRNYLLSQNNSSFSIKQILLYPLSLFSKLVKKNNLNNKSIDNDILRLTNEEYKLHKELSKIIILDLNETEGFIDLTVEDKDPYVASQIAIVANDILQRSIIDFKIKNINDTYKFINSQLEIAKNNFYTLQDSLARFSDRNKNIKSDVFKNQYNRIEAEFLISKNIYNELAISKEKTAIDVKKNTPIFTIIKPVVIPNEKSGPVRSVISLFFIFFGISISIIFILLKSNFLKIWKEINS